MNKIDIQEKIDELYTGVQAYSSAGGVAEAIIKPIVQFLENNPNEIVELDFDKCNLKNKLVLDSLTCIVVNFDDNKKNRTRILNCPINDFGTEVDSKVNNLLLYQSAQRALIHDNLVQNMFVIK